MKNKKVFSRTISLLCIPVICAVFGIALIVHTNGISEADASTLKYLSYEDNFDSASLDADNWYATEGIEHRTQYSALQINACNVWGSYVNLQKQKLSSEWGHVTIDITADWLNATNGWTGVFFGNTSATANYMNSKYFLYLNAAPDKTTAGSDELQKCNDAGMSSGIRIASKVPGGAGFYETYGKNSHFIPSDVWKQADLNTGGKIVYIRLQFDLADNEEYEIEEGERMHVLTMKWGFTADDLNHEYVFDKLPIDINGYMGFTTWGSHYFEMRHFCLTADDIELIDDDFSSADISYPSLPSAVAAWRCVGVDEGNVYCGNVCNIDFSGVKNGNLIYTTPLSKNEYSTVNFEWEYTLSLGGIGESTYIGSGFGFDSFTDSTEAKAYIGFRKVGEEYKLALIKNGTVVGDETAFNVVGRTMSMRYVGNYDDSIDVYVNDKHVATYREIDFEGYASISAFSLTGNATGNDTTIDDFAFYEYETLFADNDDYRINFKGRKERQSVSGSTIKDFWFNTKKWSKFGEAEEPNLSINQDRNYIMFQEASLESGFAPKAQFGDFIARFDFKVSSLDDTSVILAPFGLSFGRDNIASASAEFPGVYFEPITVANKNPDTGATEYVITGTRVKGLHMTTATGGSSQDLTDFNIFENTDNWYTCMVVVSNRTARVFLKKTEDAGDFGKPIITFTDVDAYGYVAVTFVPSGSTYAYYWATNISVMGIDLMQKESA